MLDSVQDPLGIRMDAKDEILETGAAAGGGNPPGRTGVGAGADDFSSFGGEPRPSWQFWNSYKSVLKEQFNRMTPAEKEGLIKKARIVCSLSVVTLFALLSLAFWR
ncbi:MAG: hypothetical protein K2X77_21235 [Candidatus Obscuribacterales bacterium]|nr:hypothetical protein [Candidatus Obscuribacterales bacterium]